MRSPLIRAAAIFGLMASLAACASSRTLGGSVDDLSANTTLKGVLFTDRSHDYSDVDLTIYDGRLMLSGTMRSEEGHQKLLENAWKADSVKQVIDEVIIADKTSLGQGFEDTRIDQALRAKLIADRGVTSGNYKFSVSRSVVYIIGVARDEMELDRVLNAARATAGVEKVVSHVVYRSAAQAIQ